MSDDLKPRRREDEDSEEYESLFESFQQREETTETESASQSSEKKGLLEILRSLVGRRESGKKRRERVEEASTAPAGSETSERPPVFVSEEGEMDIEAARESFLADLEEEETEEKASSEKKKAGGGIPARLGLSTFQAGVLGVLLILVLLVYGALGFIVIRTRSQWSTALASPEPILTTPSVEAVTANTETPAASPSPDEEAEEANVPAVTSTPLPTPTPQPSVPTRFDLQVMRNPTDLDLRQKRGEEYLRLEAYQEAVREFQYLLDQDEKRAAAHLGLGRAYFFLRRWEDAEAELGTAISFNEDLEDAHFWLGKLFYLQGRYEMSMREFDWAAEINPDNPRNEAWLARAAVKNDDLTEAQGAAERALSLDDRSSLAYVARAEAEALAGNYDNAQGDLLYAKDIAPHNFEVLNALARLYTDHFSERLAEAERIAQQAENWATWSIDRARAMHALGRVYLAQGRKEAAREALARASDLATVDGEIAIPGIVTDFDRAVAPEN
jgi:tetratricopeptide (TPR) repeat protein